MTGGRRIGILGGTFDPVHVGHLRAAQEVQGGLRLARVVFVPNRVPPHKDPGRAAEPADRLAMVRAAIRGNRGFDVSDVELARPGPSYTIETLDHFRAVFGDAAELHFLLGTDAFTEIATWRRAGELFARADFVVMLRPGARFPRLADVLPAAIGKTFRRERDGAWRHASGRRLVPFPVTALDVSSSDLRARVHRGESIRYLAPDAVVRYIRARALYR
jgi:nicotinate-nucleotide adenylyltransferase